MSLVHVLFLMINVVVHTFDGRSCLIKIDGQQAVCVPTVLWNQYLVHFRSQKATVEFCAHLTARSVKLVINFNKKTTKEKILQYSCTNVHSLIIPFKLEQNA